MVWSKLADVGIKSVMSSPENKFGKQIFTVAIAEQYGLIKPLCQDATRPFSGATSTQHTTPRSHSMTKKIDRLEVSSVEYNFAALTNKFFVHWLERGQRSPLKRHSNKMVLTRNFSKQKSNHFLEC